MAKVQIVLAHWLASAIKGKYMGRFELHLVILVNLHPEIDML